MENWALRSASTLSTISPEMLAKLESKISAPAIRRTFIPNWIHHSLATEIERQRTHPPERQASQLLYSGNVGVKQGLPDFVDLFQGMESGWQLRIQGGGAERQRLEERTRDLPSIVLADVSGEDAYVHSLLQATACLITQKPDVSANFLPSKLLPALATGTPVLAVCQSDSPLGREVSQGGYGAVLDPNDGTAIADTLRTWKESPQLLKDLQTQARQRSQTFERETILRQYEQELQRLTNASMVNHLEPSTSEASTSVSPHLS